jgi:hypothetical protein
MRLSVATVALSICLWPLAGAQLLAMSPSYAAAPPTAAAPPSAAAPSAPPSAAAPSAPPDGGGASADAAAALHTKRTACLKQAKAKKLVGAQKTAFIKDCVASS